MANLVYERVPTDRQNLVLDEAGTEDPVTFEEEGGTSSRLQPALSAGAAGVRRAARVREAGRHRAHLRDGPHRPPAYRRAAPTLRRARRARLTPEAIGLPRSSTRRLNGLRRAEVAAPAGITPA
ncbi:hypothetical protein ACFVH0_13030 [Streptomyces sp. NPDC127117]|uniref:hypothetical protein n=1 Tax=Streptomyces sp. NPDC127117 TaxID=3345368 RepID=UPI00363BBB9C